MSKQWLVLILVGPILGWARMADGADDLSTARETIVLKQNSAANQVWTLNEQLDMDMKTTFTSKGRSRVTHDVNSVKVSGVRAILEAKGGAATKVRLQFDKDCGAKVQLDGKDQPTRFPLAGETVTLTINEVGALEVEPKEVFGSDGAQLMQYAFNAQRVFSPGRPVAIGDTWTIKPEVIAKASQLRVDGTLKGRITCKLDRIVIRDGRKIADMTQKCSIAGTMDNGGELSLNYEAPWSVDIATGETVLLESRGEMITKTSAKDLAAGQPDIHGFGTMKTSFRARMDAANTPSAH